MSDKREITFENARVGDEVFSPLFSWHVGQKTNGKIVKISNFISVMFDNDNTTLFGTDGSFGCGWKGQVLFWENPIKEIPVRPKRKVTKTGYIGVVKPIFTECLAGTTNIYGTEKELRDYLKTRPGYHVQSITFDMMEE